MLLMARDDITERLGATAEWKLFGTGPAIVNAFEAGELDLAYIGLPPAIIGIDRGIGIVCIAGGHMEGTVIAGGNKLCGFPVEQDIQVILRQLSGRKIGVPGKGSIHDVIISDCLEKYSLKKNVEVVNFPWADLVLEAMVKKEVSAVVGTPALAVAVKTFASGKILYPPSRLWPNNPSYGILVSKDFLEEQREAVENFLLLHEEATAFLRNAPAEAARIIAHQMGFIDAEFVLETLRVSPKYCAQLTDEFISSTVEFSAALRRLGYIRREIASQEIFDASIISKIHPGKDHYGDGLSNVP